MERDRAGAQTPPATSATARDSPFATRRGFNDAVAPLHIDTPQGEARVRVTLPREQPRAALVLGHGAGGGVAAPDLLAAARVAGARGYAVALVEQPYRVAGRRTPPRAPRLDEAWEAICAELAAGELAGLAQVTGGRSSGARVACRTAAATGAAAVLCLAFPLQPAPRRDGSPTPSRQPELDAVAVPVLVVQGENDRFGMVEGHPRRMVARVAGDHSLTRDLPAVQEAIGIWLDAVGLGLGLR